MTSLDRDYLGILGHERKLMRHGYRMPGAWYRVCWMNAWRRMRIIMRHAPGYHRVAKDAMRDPMTWRALDALNAREAQA